MAPLKGSQKTYRNTGSIHSANVCFALSRVLDNWAVVGIARAMVGPALLGAMVGTALLGAMVGTELVVGLSVGFGVVRESLKIFVLGQDLFWPAFSTSMRNGSVLFCHGLWRVSPIL